MTQTKPRSTNPTILVTAPAGKVGRRLIPLLARRGVTVRAASRSLVAAPPGIEPVRFDWTGESTYEAVRKGVDAMYLVAGPIPGPEHARLQALNVAWTILNTARFMTNTPFPFSWHGIKELSVLAEPTGAGRIGMIDPGDVGAVAAKILTAGGHEGKAYS